MSNNRHDFIVIGSGFGGAVSALRLAEKGYSVLVLEQGKRYRPEDFPETSWNLRRYLWNPKLGLHGIQAMTRLRDVFVLHGVGVGGGSLVYANTLLVPPDRFFADPAWAGLADWQQQLAPHYDTVRQMLGAVVVPEGACSGTDELLREVAEQMGRAATFYRPTVGVYFNEPGVAAGTAVADPYFGGQGPRRAGCVRCGGCMVGCRHRAKSSLDLTYLHLAERLGAAMLPERRVVDVAPAQGGGYEVTSLRSTALGASDRRRHRAEQVVIAAGVLGTVDLLLSCRARGSLPHLSEQLGNFARTNSEAILAVTTRRRDVDYSEGLALSAGFYPDDDTHIELGRYPAGSDFMSLIATVLTDGGPGLPRPLRWLGNIVRRPGDFARTLWPCGWAKRSATLTVMQPLDSYLRLRHRRSWLGRKLDSDRGDGPPIPTYIPIAHEVARKLAVAMDGVPQSVLAEVLLGQPLTAHILGGCKMGPSPAQGVIDSQNRVFGYPGMYVIDGSMIAANLGVNPSLTIAALAERALTYIPPKGSSAS